MEEGEIDYREKGVVEEGPEPAGDEAIVEYSDDEHQVFDEMPVRVRQFYFVKLLPLENPMIDAMIKKAEETIEKMNQDQVLLAQKIRTRVMESDDMRTKLSMINYYDNCELTPNWHRERLDILHLSLDKLTFANNAYKEKSMNSCLSGGEVDKQIQRLEEKMCFNYWDCEKATDNLARDKAILKDIKQHKIARERAIAGAVVNGKLWNSLGSQEAIQAELQALCNNSDELEENQIKVNAKIKKVKRKLEKVEKDISSLQKRLKYTNRKKDAVYNAILKLKKQYEEENACCHQFHSLMKTVEVLAKKKDIAAVQELSQAQVEKFMQQWNSCQNFRNDYKKRVVPSLNCLASTGRSSQRCSVIQ